MVTKLFKYLGIFSLVLSYTCLIANYQYHGLDSQDTPIFYLAWGAGVLSVISNGVYAIKTGISELVLSTYGLVALIWLAPFFIELDWGYGIPSLLIYLILVIYIHIRKPTATA